MRPRKITDAKIPRLIEVARVRLKAQELLGTVPVNKQLAYEVGVTPNYLHNVMHRLTTILRTGQHVSHETLRSALANDEQFAVLMIQLKGRAERRAAIKRSAEEEWGREPTIL